MEPRIGPVFIVGADRSGTTLVRLLLNAHSQIAVPVETWFLIDLMNEFGDERLGPEEVRRAVDLVTSRRRFPTFHVTRESLTEAVSAGPDTSVEEFFGRFMGLVIENSGKPNWIDKTPEYVLHLERIRSLFPDALFINVSRDGRDVFSSLQPLRWRGRTPWRIGRYWSRCIMAAVEAEDELPAHRWLWIQYEDVVLDLKATLDRICSFLGLEFEPAMVDFHATAPDNLTDREIEQGFHDKLSRPISVRDAFRYRQGTRSIESWMFEAVAARALTAANYQSALPAWLRPAVYGLALTHHVVYSAFAKLARAKRRAAP